MPQLPRGHRRRPPPKPSAGCVWPRPLLLTGHADRRSSPLPACTAWRRDAARHMMTTRPSTPSSARAGRRDRCQQASARRRRRMDAATALGHRPHVAMPRPHEAPALLPYSSHYTNLVQIDKDRRADLRTIEERAVFASTCRGPRVAFLHSATPTPWGCMAVISSQIGRIRRRPIAETIEFVASLTVSGWFRRRMDRH